MHQILSGKIVEIAHARRRFGYRRIHDLLRPDHPGINHKRVYRLYKAHLAEALQHHDNGDIHSPRNPDLIPMVGTDEGGMSVFHKQVQS